MKFPGHSFIALTIALTVYSQVMIRWQMSQLLPPPTALGPKFLFLLQALFRPWIMSSVVATFLAGLCWMAVLSRFPLSYAFPFMALNFVLVLFASALFFNEPLTLAKIAGNMLIVAGVFVLAIGHR